MFAAAPRASASNPPSSASMAPPISIMETTSASVIHKGGCADITDSPPTANLLLAKTKLQREPFVLDNASIQQVRKLLSRLLHDCLAGHIYDRELVAPMVRPAGIDDGP